VSCLSRVFTRGLAQYLIGPTIFVYGAAGPAYGSFEISLDGQSNVFSAYAPQNASGHLLFSATTLEYANHTLKVTNLGAKDGDNGGNQLLFDYFDAGVQLAPAGSVTLENLAFRVISKLNSLMQCIGS
jgi:hypothetical protein